MTSTLYMRTGQGRPLPATVPSGYLGGWGNVALSPKVGAAAGQLLPTSGAAQVATAVTSSATASIGMVQFLSAPLAGGIVIAAANWTVAWAAQGSRSGWSASCYIALVNGTTGATRTVIAAAGTVGATGRAASSELTVWSSTLAGLTATTTAGDYLVVEIAHTPGSSLSTTDTAYTDGAAAVSSDNAAASAAASLVICPTTLTTLGQAADTLVPTDSSVLALSPYASAILGHSPEAYWPLTETSGPTFGDTTGHGHTATLVGSVTLGVSGPNPLGAAQFDGSTAYATVATLTNFPVAGAYTIEAWGYATNSGLYGILGYGNYGTSNQVNAFRTDTDAGLTNYWWAQDLDVTGLPSFRNGWHHVCVTYDGVSVRTIYLDGRKVTGDAPTGHLAGLTNGTLAATNSGASEKWLGALAHIALYPVCLTPSQLAQHIAAMQAPLVVALQGADTLTPADRSAATPFVLLATAETLTPSDAGTLALLSTVTLTGADTLVPADTTTAQLTLAPPRDTLVPADTGRLWQAAHSAPIVLTTVDALVGPAGTQVGYTVDLSLTASSLPLSSTQVFAQLQSFRTQVPADTANFPSGYPTDLSILCGGQPIDCDVACCRSDKILLRFALQSPLAASTTDGTSYTLVWGSTTWTAPRNLAKVFPWFDDFLDTAVNPAYALFGMTAAQSGNGILATTYVNDGSSPSGVWLTSIPAQQGLDMEISVDVEVALARLSWASGNTGDLVGVGVRDANNGTLASMGTVITPPTYFGGEPQCMRWDVSTVSNSYGVEVAVSTWYTMRFQAVNLNLATIQAKTWASGWNNEPAAWGTTRNVDLTADSKRASATLITPISANSPNTTIAPSFRYWRVRIAVLNPPTLTTSILVGADTLVPADTAPATLLLGAADTLTPRDSATATSGAALGDTLLPTDALGATLLLSRADTLTPADSQGSSLSLQLVGTDRLVPTDAGTLALSIVPVANTGDTLSLTETVVLTLALGVADALTCAGTTPATLVLGVSDTRAPVDAAVAVLLLYGADTLGVRDAGTAALHPYAGAAGAGLYEPARNVVVAGVSLSAVVVSRLAPGSVTYVLGGAIYTDTVAAASSAQSWPGGGTAVIDRTVATYVTFAVPALGGAASWYIVEESAFAAVRAAQTVIGLDLVSATGVRRYQS